MRNLYPSLAAATPAKQLKQTVGKAIRYFGTVLLATIVMITAASVKLFAQAPAISYSTPPTYTINSAITPLIPTNSGGTVPSLAYSSALTSIGQGFTGQTAIAVDAAGNVYVTFSNHNAVKKFPVGGGASSLIGTGFSSPQGVAVDAAGNVYVTDTYHGAVKKIAAAGGATTTIASGFSSPIGIAVDAAGNIYFTDNSNGTVYKIPAGSTVPVTLSTAFNSPSAVAVDGAGNLYIADQGNNAIKMIPAGGGSPVAIGSGFNQPQGVAVDGAGNVYVADLSNNAVKMIPAGGGAPVVLTTAITSPSDIAIGVTDNLYISNQTNSPSQEMSPIGGYFINTTLPAGLSFNTGTGVISGTPIAASPATNYTVTAFNSSGSGQAAVNIKVLTNNTSLSNLLLSSGTLTPAFATGTKNYTETVGNTVASITITPTTADGSATIKINGTTVASGSASTAIPLSFGDNNFTIVVTDGAVIDTYTLTVTRPALTIATLSNLTISTGTFTPAFATGTTSYTELVSNATTSVTVTPTVTDATATVTINGTTVASGSASAALPLIVGDNAITTTVTAQDGVTTDTYTINVVRPPSGLSLSYAGPQTFTAAQAVTLAPTSSGVAAYGYASSAVTFASGFNGPGGIGTDAAGNIYVADQGNKLVKKIPAGGGTPIAVGSGFTSPSGVAIDPSGNMWVIDSGDLKEIPAGGGAITTKPFGDADGVAVDSKGNVYVLETSGGYGAITEFLVGGGTGFASNDDNNYDTGIAVDRLGNIFESFILPIAEGSQIAEYSPNNYPGINGLGNNLYSPTGVAVDCIGNVFVIDEGYGAVIEFPANSAPQFTIAAGLSQPNGIALDGAGNIYESNGGTNTVQEIKAAGGYFISPGLPAGLNFDENTGIISGTPTGPSPATNYTITAHNSSGSTFATLNITVVLPLAPVISYSSPQTYTVGMAISPLTPSSSGGAVATPAYNNTPVVLGSYTAAQGVAVDVAGNIYVANTNQTTISKLPAGGGAAVTIGSGFNGPQGIAVDAAGNIYVADSRNTSVSGSKGAVYKIATGGSTKVSIGSGFVTPEGVAVDAAGNVYVADMGNNTITEIPTGGGALVTLGSGFNKPSGVAVDAAGNIYVADTGNNAVKELPAGGGAPVTLGFGFNAPQGIAVDFEGNVFVGETGNSDVREISAGSVTTIASNIVAPGLAIDGAGRVYAAAGSVNQFTPVGGYYISALPAGLGFNQTTGVISGTPTVMSPATNYTVTAYNLGGSGSTTVNIKVINNPITLANLVLSSGTLTPSFASGTTAYSALVPATITSITVTPTTSLGTSTVTVNGTTVASGSASASILLANGPNTITTIVTGADGVSTNTYTVTVTRVPSPDATLSALALSLGTLTPSFSPTVTSYTSSVLATDPSITITPTTDYPLAVVTVNGTTVASGTASSPITLVTGQNTITVVVTAENGITKQTYTVTINKPVLDITALSYVSPQNYMVSVPISPLVPTSANVSPDGYNQYGGNGIGNLTFEGRYGSYLGLDASGNAYESMGGIVQKYSFSGPPVTVATGLNAPTGIVVDAAGDIYVADELNNNVVEFKAGGGQATFTGFSDPQGLAIDATGNVYVSDSGNNAVKEIPAGGGTIITVISGVTAPTGLAIDGSGNIYVADNIGIQKLPAGGTVPITLFPGVGAGPIGVDAAGNIFATGDEDVVEYPAAGGSPKELFYNDPFEFSYSNVAVDPAGDVYTIQYNVIDITPQENILQCPPDGGYHLNKFLPKGLSFSSSTGVISGTPGAASPATDYTVTAIGNTGNKSAVVNITVAPYAAPAFSYSSPQTYAQGSAIVPLTPTSIGVAPPAYSSSATVVASGFNEPQGVAADAAGNVYVADGGHGLVKKIPPGGSPASIGTGFSKPSSVAVDAAGNVYVADFTNNAVYEIASGGSTTSIASGFNHPTGVAVDAAGNVYVADNGNNAVKEIPSGGGSPVTFASTPNPYGVAVDGAGNVYVGNGGAATITMIPAGGGTPVNVGSGFINPFGVAADVMGNVFVVDSGHALVKEIPAGGGAPVTIGPGGGDELFGIAVNGAGNVYVTDQTANTVKEISPIGGYYIGTALPAGLSFNQTTGTISGTPTALSPATNYTVTAYNVAGSGQATVNIKVVLNPITLASLVLSSGTLTPTFASGTNNYTASVINAVSSMTVTPTATDPDPAVIVRVNGVEVISGMPSESIPLAVGPNTITTVVTGPDGVSTNTYTVIVTRPPSADARLADLALSSGTLTPSFLTVTTSYTASVSSSTTSITVTPTTNDATATVTVNGATVASGSPSASIPLAIGDNTITTIVTAQDGTTTETYTVVVTRPSTDATLASLTLSAGFLTPSFATGTTSYTVSVLNATNTITLTPTTNNANATVTVNGAAVTSGSASSNIPLAYGPNVITTVVTAQDGITTDTYTVTVTRVKPTYNPDLASITTNPKESTLVGVTGPGNLNYTEAVTNSTTSIQVIPTALDPNATITVNGVAVISGAASASIPLAIGANTITTVVTSALGGYTKTIILTVDRAGPSSNAEIASITTNPKESSLVGVTGPGYLNYSEAVTNGTTSIEVIAATKDPNATMTVNGTPTISGTASAPIALAIGPNLITTVVTAQDGVTTKTVTITVNRAGPSSNAEIASIATYPYYRLTGATGPGYLNYTVSIYSSTPSIQIIPTAKDPNATITVNGSAVTSGDKSSAIALSIGANTITTVVTAQDGITTKTVIITVNYTAPPDNNTYQQISVTKPADNVSIVSDGIVVHEGVSPNGDGINDYLTIDGISNYPDNRLLIVDRNGVMIYQIKGYDNSSKLFDGHSNVDGKMQLPGTYFYSLDYTANGENKHKTGYIILKY